VAVSRDLPILTSANTPDEDVLGIRALYFAQCAAAGKRPPVEAMPFFRHVFVAEDAKQAVEIPRDSVTWVRDLNSLRRTLTGGSEIYMDLEHWRRTRTVAVPSYEEELRTTAYFGTPEQLVQRIRWLQQEHNVQYFGASMSFGKMRHADVMRSMELFARDVMPKFR
jgi:alkanesulfonate monooxygenase SsuD/methylene tetrahydromethanopterin reductase-like flavin-dependent oxidoreductase (luciferase family)